MLFFKHNFVKSNFSLIYEEIGKKNIFCMAVIKFVNVPISPFVFLLLLLMIFEKGHFLIGYLLGFKTVSSMILRTRMFHLTS